MHDFTVHSLSHKIIHNLLTDVTFTSPFSIYFCIYHWEIFSQTKKIVFGIYQASKLSQRLENVYIYKYKCQQYLSGRLKIIIKYYKLLLQIPTNQIGHTDA